MYIGDDYALMIIADMSYKQAASKKKPPKPEKPQKEKPPKPKYNTWQNTVYVIRGARARNKTVVPAMIAQMLLIPAIPAVAMFLPKTIVALILDDAQARTLVTAVLIFTAALMLLQMAKTYLDRIVFIPRMALRNRSSVDIVLKAAETDYANLEDEKFTDAKQKALGVISWNSASTERVYYTLENFGANLLGFVVYMALLASVNPLVLALAAALSAMGFAVRRWANKWRYDHDGEQAAYGKRLWHYSRIGEDIKLAKDIRLFAMADWINDVYNAYLRLRHSWERKAQTREFIADAADCAASFLREGAAYAFLIWQILYNGMPVDQFVLLFAAIGGFSGWIMGILSEYSQLQRNSLDYCRLREYLEYPDLFKRGGGEPIAPEAGKTHALELRNVSFRYPGAEKDTLQNISLTVRAGEKLAIVGLNGAGKTTLVKLLCGFYDPTAGEVLLDGRDIRVYDRTQYYSLFTAVFQEFNILPVSVAENIAQRPSDELDRGRAARCMELAGLTEKIDAMPDGVDTPLRREVHENAAELSGGEIQRLMLARALYKDAPVLILDEPTAALDPIAESRLYERYNELSTGRTSVYISHRLASMRFCDRIILIDDSAIAESGTHDELLAAGGKYANLFEVQSKYYREEADA